MRLRATRQPRVGFYIELYDRSKKRSGPTASPIKRVDKRDGVGREGQAEAEAVPVIARVAQTIVVRQRSLRDAADRKGGADQVYGTKIPKGAAST
jgi:hypothetical protein